MNIQNILIQNISGDVVISEGNTFTVLGGKSIINNGTLLIDGTSDDLTIVVTPSNFNTVCLQNISGDVAISLNQSKIECIIINDISGDVSGRAHAKSSVSQRVTGDCYLVID